MTWHLTSHVVTEQSQFVRQNLAINLFAAQ
jgi:hypothetical protein